jgi:DNA-binding transcriptional regulator/RsmH inhibitor MraZ
MSDKKISELDAITGANTAADDLFIVVDSSGSATKKISRAELTNSLEVEFNQLNSNLDTNSNNINFGDNDKAQFGAGNDLQIYHDGFNSYISEGGTGNLFLGATNLFMRSSTGETYIGAVQDGAVTLYHNNAAKLASSSTGVTVTGNAKFTGTGRIIKFDKNGSGEDNAIYYDNTTANNNLFIGRDSSNIAFRTGGSERMRIDSSGKVGIGTSSPSYKFQIAAGTNSLVTYAASVLNGNIFFDTQNTSTGASAGIVQRLITSDVAGTGSISADFQKTKAGALNINNNETNSAAFTAFGVGGAERMRIDSNGQIGISGSTASFDTTGAVNGLQLYYETDSGLASLGSYSGGGSTQLTFHTNSGGGASSERLRIDSSGNLLVGKTALGSSTDGLQVKPVGELVVTSNSNHSLVMNRKSSDGNIALFQKNGTTTGLIGTLGGRMFAGSGDVGVFFDSTNNAITPYSTDANDTVDNAIDLGLSSRRYKDLRLSGRVYATHVELGASGSFINFENSNYSIQGSANNGYLRFLTNGSERVRIDSSGRVGIGTSSPSTKLHISGNASNASALSDTVTDFALKFDSATTSGNFSNAICFAEGSNVNASIASFDGGSGGAQGLVFGTGASNTERMRITHEGDVGIGRSDPQNIVGSHGGGLVVKSASGRAATTTAVAFQDSSGNNQFQQLHNGQTTFSTGSTERFRIDSGGNVTITSGGLQAIGVYNNTTGTGANLVVDSAGGFARSTSSLRYKNTVNDATHGLTELLALRPVTYKGNNDGDTVFGGLIAEEVHDAGLTEFVTYNDDGEPDALAYGNMVSLCIKAIQEQQATITALEARIAALEAN